MDYLPTFMNIKGRKVLVDGGGHISARRVERSLSAGALVTVCDENPCDDLRQMLGHDRITYLSRTATRDDIRGAFMVYGASEDNPRDAQLYHWTRDENCLCNIADEPDICDFITPSIVDRSPILIAISTSGAAPIIARILRARIEATLPATFGRLAQFTAGFRTKIAQTIPTGRERRHFWERMIEGPAGDIFLAGDTPRAEAHINRDLDNYAEGATIPVGEVYLVGAGPGDPDLLTFRALRLMQRADVVLYDRQISPEILSLVRRDAERVHTANIPQNDIAETIVRLAREGNRVLRLKDGDPFIFGQGAEEIETLTQEGIGFQIVPGITAAAGCGAYAGIPLTHIKHAQSCLFVALHGDDCVQKLDWGMLFRPAQTASIYMEMLDISVITEGFSKHGGAIETPIAIIINGTQPDQKVITGTIQTIENLARDANLNGPAMIIIGDVVLLRNTLDWGHDDGLHQMSLSSATTQDI